MKSTIRTSSPRLVGLALAAALVVALPGLVSAEPQRQTVVAGTYKANGFHRFLLGSDYRDTWATPVSGPAVARTASAAPVSVVRILMGRAFRGA